MHHNTAELNRKKSTGLRRVAPAEEEARPRNWRLALAGTAIVVRPDVASAEVPSRMLKIAISYPYPTAISQVERCKFLIKYNSGNHAKT